MMTAIAQDEGESRRRNDQRCRRDVEPFGFEEGAREGWQGEQQKRQCEAMKKAEKRRGNCRSFDEVGCRLAPDMARGESTHEEKSLSGL